jgi:hypothetical protein
VFLASASVGGLFNSVGVRGFFYEQSLIFRVAARDDQAMRKLREQDAQRILALLEAEQERLIEEWSR